MCAVSNVGDYYGRTIPEQHPWANPFPGGILQPQAPTKAEFDALKRKVEEMHELLLAAKKIDAATGQPDCEMEEKVGLLKRVAEIVGVDLRDVFPEPA